MVQPYFAITTYDFFDKCIDVESYIWSSSSVNSDDMLMVLKMDVVIAPTMPLH